MIVLNLIAATTIAPQVAAAPKPVPIPWSAAAGRPRVNFSKVDGIYVWHEGNRFHLVSAGIKPTPDVANGFIAMRGGKIYDLDPIRRERMDKMALNENRVRFHLTTSKGSDGLEFSLSKGRFLVVNVRQPATSRPIFFGGRAIPASGSPLVFDLRR